MVSDKVRVWAGDDRAVQHFTSPPDSDTAHQWEGTTDCGLDGRLRWVYLEHVDAAKACEACTPPGTPSPTLEGDHPGPV